MRITQPKTECVNLENFEALLNWLDPDRKAAAKKYEKLRRLLIVYFNNNGCWDAEAWTDVTLDRVGGKILAEKIPPMENPEPWIWKFAYYILSECRRHQAKQQSLDDNDSKQDSKRKQNEIKEDDDAPDTEEDRRACQKQCLRELPLEQRQRIVLYHNPRLPKKILAGKRWELAKRLEVSIESLRVMMRRLREKLNECVKKCLEQKG